MDTIPHRNWVSWKKVMAVDIRSVKPITKSKKHRMSKSSSNIAGLTAVLVNAITIPNGMRANRKLTNEEIVLEKG